MAISMAERRERLKQRAKDAAKNRKIKGGGRKTILDLSKIETVKWYEPKAGGKNKNVIDIVPFVITQKWYKDLHSFSGKALGLEVGDLDYKLEIPVHPNIGTLNANVLCLREMFGGKCPICDDMFEEWGKKGTADFDEKKAKALQPKWRDFYIVYDYKDPDFEGFKIWDMSYHLFEKYLMEAAEISDEGFIAFSDPIDGRTIEWVGNERKIGEKGTPFVDAGSCQAFRFLNRDEPYTDEEIEDNFSLDELLHIPTYDEVCRIHYDLPDEEKEEEQEEQQEQEKPSRSRGRTRKKEEPEKEEMEKEFDQDECPAGGVMGQDCQKFDECQNDCPEEKFERCSALHAESSRPSRGRRRVAEQAEEKQEEQKSERPARTRRRR